MVAESDGEWGEEVLGQSGTVGDAVSSSVGYFAFVV